MTTTTRTDRRQQPVHVRYSDGRTADHVTYEAAVSAIEAEWPDAEIGHDGGLLDGGDRTLCWPDEAASENDPGVRAVASIYWQD